MSVRVMVVDDSNIARTMIKDALSKGGFEVVAEAGGGKQAMDLLERARPDLVTMDYNMPDIDGEETLRLMLAKKPETKVLMLTALAESMMTEDLLKLGAKAVLAKPFKTDDFLRVIRTILKADSRS